MGIDWTFWPSDPYWELGGYWDSLDWRPPWIHPSRPGSIRWSAQRTVEPTSSVMGLDDVKQHLRVDVDDDDTYIMGLIDAAADLAENVTGLAILQQTWQLYVDNWPRQDRLEFWPMRAWPPGSFLLPRYPVQSVSSITWIGADGSSNPVNSTNYKVDTVSRPARVVPATNSSWPTSSALAVENGIVVEFIAGYPSFEVIPKGLRQAMLLIIGHWYETRETVISDLRAVSIEIPMTARELLANYTPALVG